MPFNVLCGPANSGKVAAVFDDVEQAVRSRRPTWLVVPTSSDARSARAELVRRVGAIVGVDIGTFHQLYAWLAGPIAAHVISTPVSRMHIGRILRRSRSFSQSLLDFPGYLDRACRIIQDVLEAQLVDHMRGDAAGTELGQVLGALVPAERARWVAIAGEYQRVLDHLGYVDDAALARRAWQRCEQPVDVDVFLYGFDDVSSLQKQLLGRLGSQGRVTMSMPFVPGRVLFDRRQRELDELVSCGARITHRDSVAAITTDLDLLAQRVGEPTAMPIDNVGSCIRIIESCGDLGEAEDIVRVVADLVSQGYQLHEIACISPDPTRLRSLIEACCARHAIPVEIETSRVLADVPAGRLVLDLMAAGRDHDEPALLRLLRSGHVVTERLDHIEHAVQPWIEDHDLARSPRRPRVPTNVFGPAIRALLQGATASDPAAMLREAIGELRLGDSGDIRLIRSVESMLCDLSDSTGARPPTWSDIADALGGMVLPPRDDRPTGHLVVAPISRVRTARFRAVVLFGLQASGFASGSTDDPDAPSLAREALYTAVTRPREQLIIARQACGADGREVAPHSVWYDIHQIVPSARVERRTLGDVLPQRVVFEHERALWEAHTTEHGETDTHPWSEDLSAEHELLDGSISVTSLETYVQCPSKWFIEHRLLRRDHDLATSRQVIGRLVHDALAHMLIKPDVLFVDDDGQLRARASRDAVEAQMEASCSRLDARTPLREIDVLAATLIVARVMDGEAVYGNTVLTEQPFGKTGSSVPSLEIDGIRITGVIDRFDITESGDVTIIDYKLGSSSSATGSKMVSLGKLQLLLYWHAIAQQPGTTPVAAIYRPLSGSRPRGLIDDTLGPTIDGQYTTDRFSSDAVDHAISEALALAQSSLAALRAGNIAPAPRGGTCPDWCTLGTICRIGETR